MDRLTKHSSSFICNSSNCIIVKCEQCENRLPSCYEEDCNATVAIVDRLAYFEDLQEQGRLVILPCKAGDTVYFYGKPCRRKLDYNECEKAFDKKGNINIWCEKDCLEKDIVISRKFGIEDLKNINKTVFLTKAEAQAALERMEGQE